MITVPEELLVEIFLRVPARYMFGLKIVCKSWNVLISNPQFVSTHFDHNKTKQILFIGYCQRLRRKSLSLISLNQQPNNLFYTTHGRPRPLLNFPSFFNDCFFAGSINGIICVSSCFYHGVALWNPAINHWKVISLLPAKPGDNAYTSISMAFDSLTNDYKIIRLVSLRTKSLPESRIEVYSCNQDSWIHIDKPISFMTTRLNSSVIVKGVPYWSKNYLQVDDFHHHQVNDVHHYQSNFFAAIDPHTGLYKKIEYPSFVKNPFTNVLPFSLMDSLAVLIYLPSIYPNKKFRVYTLDQTCATWNEMYTISPTLLQNRNMCILRCFEDADKIVVVGWDYDHRRSFLYDLKTDSLCHNTGMDAFRPKWDESYHHVESLFSLKGMVPISEEEDSNYKFDEPLYWRRQLGMHT